MSIVARLRAFQIILAAAALAIALTAYLVDRLPDGDGWAVAGRDELLANVWKLNFDPGTKVREVHIASSAARSTTERACSSSGRCAASAT